MIDTNKINAELDRRHWSKATLARLSGLGYTTVIYLLSGKVKEPLFTTVVAVCKALELPIEEVYQDADNND